MQPVESGSEDLGEARLFFGGETAKYEIDVAELLAHGWVVRAET